MFLSFISSYLILTNEYTDSEKFKPSNSQIINQQNADDKQSSDRSSRSLKRVPRRPRFSLGTLLGPGSLLGTLKSFVSQKWTISGPPNGTLLVLLLLTILQTQIRASGADEDPGSVFGKGVAFFLGEPCESTCNRILFNVFCNQTTRRCECLPEFPVNVDNKYCVKAIKIDEPCEFTESCLYTTPKSECNQDSSTCKCSEGHHPKLDDKHQLQCVPYDSPFHIRIGSRTIDIFNNVEFIAIFSLALSAFLILVLFLLVLKLLRNNANAQKAAAIAAGTQLPNPIVMSDDLCSGGTPLSSRQHSAGAVTQGGGATTTALHHHSSRSRISGPFYQNSIESSPRSYRGPSIHHNNNSSTLRPNSRSGGYFISNNLGSRHQSLSSLHSQSSFRSCSSAPDTAIDLQQLHHSQQHHHRSMASWQAAQQRANCPKHRELYRKASAPFDPQANPSPPCYPPSYVPHRQQRPLQYPLTGGNHPHSQLPGHHSHLPNGFGTMPRPKPLATPRIKSESCLVHSQQKLPHPQPPPLPVLHGFQLPLSQQQPSQQQPTQQQQHSHHQENHFVPHN